MIVECFCVVGGFSGNVELDVTSVADVTKGENVH